jgi:predicted HAD superfamily Cof-like phosphohydrolase
MPKFTEAIETFTLATGQTTDHYNVKQIGLYTGLQLEELAEKLTAFGLTYIANQLDTLSLSFKQGAMDQLIAQADRAEVLDADLDLAWVSIAAAHSTGADVAGAMAEIARSNLAKLVTCEPCSGIGSIDGQIDTPFCPTCRGAGKIALKDENGKVKKPAGWTAPNLMPYIIK